MDLWSAGYAMAAVSSFLPGGAIRAALIIPLHMIASSSQDDLRLPYTLDTNLLLVSPWFHLSIIKFEVHIEREVFYVSELEKQQSLIICHCCAFVVVANVNLICKNFFSFSWFLSALPNTISTSPAPRPCSQASSPWPSSPW